MAASGKTSDSSRTTLRERIARSFTMVEDVVYVALGVFLAGGTAVLLLSLAFSVWRSLVAGTLAGSVVNLLDQVLLILMILELLYTVQVSFREHVLVPEPFVLVALIAGVRRILVVAAELPGQVEKGDTTFHNAMIELGVLTAMTLSLVGCLVMLRKRHRDAVAERA